ncbi:MAG TPA: SpoIIE family protein phosphatase [Kofleriaceae bacterium]|nr:SpoIIE family protein phosphatase [Kofleriaceae bacterium]
MSTHVRRRGFSVGTKLTAATVSLLAVAVGLSALYGYRTLTDQAASAAAKQRAAGEAAMARHSQLLVRNLTSAAGVSLAGGDFTGLRAQAGNALAGSSTLEWLVVAFGHGHDSQIVVATSGAPGAEGEPLEDELSAQLGAHPTSTEILSMRATGDPHLTVFGANIVVRLADGSARSVGELRLSNSTRELETLLAAQLAEARHEARVSARRQLMAAGVVLLLGMLVGAYQGLRISRPLQALEAQASAIAGGDFDRRVDVRSRDEVGQLADSFNTMAESLGTLLDEMAAKASLERELELARSVQELMSPPPTLHTAGTFRLAGRCQLAEQCGGDWWSYRQLGGERLLLVVGDVTGHGMPAAMIAATARGAVEALAMNEREPLTPLIVLEAIDRAIRDVSRQELLMTCFALVADPRAGVVDFANAGHCFPYVLRPGHDGRLRKPGVLAVRGNPLGTPNKVINTGQRAIEPGDVLVLTSDGLTDRVDSAGDRFGEKRLRALMVAFEMGSSGDQVLVLRDQIMREVDAFGGNTPADDDMTLVVCQMAACAEVDAKRGAA